MSDDASGNPPAKGGGAKRAPYLRQLHLPRPRTSLVADAIAGAEHRAELVREIARQVSDATASLVTGNAALGASYKPILDRLSANARKSMMASAMDPDPNPPERHLSWIESLGRVIDDIRGETAKIPGGLRIYPDVTHAIALLANARDLATHLLEDSTNKVPPALEPTSVRLREHPDPRVALVATIDALAGVLDRLAAPAAADLAPRLRHWIGEVDQGTRLIPQYTEASLEKLELDLDNIDEFVLHGRSDPADSSADVALALELVHDARVGVKNVLSHYREGPEAQLRPSEAAALLSEAPAQKTGPVHFAFVDNVLTVASQADRPERPDIAAATAARTALLDQGDALLEALRGSNCDRRLLKTVQTVQDALRASESIVQLGVLTIACESIASGFVDELPPALLGMLTGQIRGVSMYLGQFPEWSRFVDNAATVDLTPDDIASIRDTAARVADQLTDNAAVDPQVPKLITLLQKSIDAIGPRVKHAAFAVFRTIENLVSVISREAADFLLDTGKETRELATKTFSKIIILSLLGIAVSSAGGVAPIAARVMGSEWMTTTAKAIEKVIEGLAK